MVDISIVTVRLRLDKVINQDIKVEGDHLVVNNEPAKNDIVFWYRG